MKNKVMVIMAVFMLMFSGNIYANGNENSNNGGQDHTCQGGHNCNGDEDTGSNTGGSTATATGNGGAGGSAGSDASYTDSSRSYSYSAPSLSPAVGNETSQLGSVFGSLSLSNTEDYVKETKRAEVVIALYQLGLIGEFEAQDEAQSILQELRDSSRAKRIIGVGPKTRGKHLFNLFGILATDSYRDNN